MVFKHTSPTEKYILGIEPKPPLSDELNLSQQGYPDCPKMSFQKRYQNFEHESLLTILSSATTVTAHVFKGRTFTIS